MGLNEIKEHMSRNQFKAIANRCGYKCERPADGDHGVDFRVDEVAVVQRSTGPRLLDTGRTLQFQLKATTLQSVEIQEQNFKFDLEAKTFNDLIDRKNNSYPLTLVLAILPTDETKWLTCSASEISQQTQLFWFRPENGAANTDNTSTKRITVPLINRVDLDFLPTQFKELFE